MRSYPFARVVALTACIGLLSPAAEADSQDIEAIRQEIAAMRQDYAQRIQDLERRLAKAEQEARDARQEAQRAKQTADQAATAPAGTPTESASAFNPAIGLVLNGRYRYFSRPESENGIPGFSLGEEASKGDAGLSLDESELGISANIDNLFYGQFTASFASEDGEDGVEIEEAFIQTTALPAGLGLTVGRFYSGIGYLNSFHTHADDFADRPLPYRAMLGNGYNDDGVELRWLAPTDLFLEVGADLYAGDHYPAGGRGYEGLGSWAVFSHIGGDWDESNSWKAGLSYLQAQARDRESGDAPDVFSGETRLWILDGVWKWAPNGNPYRHNLRVQGEYFYQEQEGDYSFGGAPLAYDASQYGWYLQGAYQFMPRWRVGLRIAGLHADDPGAAFAGTDLDPLGRDPRHYSVMLDWSNSEFSRVRLQYNRDDSRPRSDDQILLQYIFALGAHGAHAF